MNNTAQLLTKLTALANSLQRHMYFIMIIAFAGLCAYFLVLTSTLLQVEPSKEAVAEKAGTARTPRISKETIDTIYSLEDMNVQVRTIFEAARDNPFSE